MAQKITEALPHEVLGPQAQSVAHMLVERVAETPHADAFTFPAATAWETVSWQEFGDRVSVLAAGLLALGVSSENRVGILCNTRYEWILADMAVMRSGGATTTVYPTTLAEDVAYILADSDTQVVFAENAEQVDKLATVRDQMPSLRAVVVIDGEGDGDWVLSLGELEDRGRAHLKEHPGSVDEATYAIQPDHLATLIYTSGTTGRPKGVELLHRNWTYEGAAIQGMGLLSDRDIQYLWLPLSHSFGKMLLSAQLQLGFLTAVDGRIDKIVDNLALVRPTFMAGAPRIYEKVYARINQMQEAEGGVKKRIFDWAVGVGRRHIRGQVTGEPAGLGVGTQYKIADRLVFSKIRARLGGRIRYLVSGSAALAGEVQEWFNAAGLTLLEGYGLTETSAATSMTRPTSLAFGTIGHPLPGTEISIAADGEILVRGGGVMRGYHNKPEQTAEVFPGDGWFATGDIGEIDEAGRVKITDRKKDLIKTSGGKYIAPSLIEMRFKVLCPIASQMLVHANNRNFASALVALDPEALADWAAMKDITGKEYPQLTQDPAVRAFVQECIDQLNEGLNRWETIKKFTILGEDMTVEDGTLTPSMKLKRRAVEDRYQELLDGMYS